MRSGFGRVLPWLAVPVLWAALVALDGTTPALSTSAEVNLTSDRLAVNGFDPVAYFTDGAPVPGNSALSHEIGSVVYRFASEENRRRFKADPQRFLPAFGGFCAYGVRAGRKLPADPTAWRIVDGRLFLLLNLGTKTIWELDLEENITIADMVWPKISSLSDAELQSRAP